MIVFEEFKKMREDLQRWIWKRCPFCGSEKQPSRVQAGGGGYQDHIVLKCPNCDNSLKFITDWSPILDVAIVNEIPEMTQGEYCPYLSIQKKKDHILLRCCTYSPRDCFGRSFIECYVYHKTKMDELVDAEDYPNAAIEAGKTIELFKKEHPQVVPYLGTSQLIDIKRRILDSFEWYKWIDDWINELEAAENFGNAASIAFSVAEISGEPKYWKQASEFYNNYGDKLRIALEKETWSYKKQRKNREIVRAEIMSIEALSEIEVDRRSELLKLAGDKWLNLFDQSADPFSHKEFLYYVYHINNYALAEPKEAFILYKKAHDFLVSQLDKLEYSSERTYYQGHAKYYLGLHYLTNTNNISDPDERICLLKKAIFILNEAIELHNKIGLNSAHVNILINVIKSVLCLEKFKKEENYDLINEAEKHLDNAKHFGFPHNMIKATDALIGTYKEAFSAVENPEKALLLMTTAKTKLSELIELLPNIRIKDMPIHKMLKSNIDYLKMYLDIIQRNITSFAGRRINFNNIIVVLNIFRELTESQLYQAFIKTPYEDTGRCLVQALLAGAFSQRKFQFREVMVAKGKSDNLLIMSMEKYPFEIKIWDGKKYYEKGLGQIKYYMNYENVPYGFYIIFDPRVKKYKSGGEDIKFDSKRIYQLFIHINPKKP